MSLRWSWLATPYIVCAAVIAAVALAGALVRGDRVLRLGVVGAGITALPWAVCHAVTACTDDPVVAVRLLRLGQGPIAMVGPNLMLVMLGVSGQLERYRWVARVSGLVGLCLLVLCWATRWIVPGVQLIPSGMFYIQPGPLTGLHISQLVLWMLVGLWIARRSAPVGGRRRTLRLLLGILVLAAVGSLDTMLLYGVWGIYPIAWLPTTLAAGLALYLVLRTDFLRPQGFDRPVAVELLFSAGAFAALAVVLLFVEPSLLVVTLGASVWALASGAAWMVVRSRPVRVVGERELEQFVARVATFDDEAKIADRLRALWTNAIAGIELRALWWRDDRGFVQANGERWPVDPELVAWLTQHADVLVLTELGTMKVGTIRTKLEALVGRGGGDGDREGGLIVPLVDRDELVGIVEGFHTDALRESERGLIADSARAAARALTFVGLARAASLERETAREVEIADALRLQAGASRDAELGRWAVAAEYRTAPRTTGAGWSAIELLDGRLALLVTEAQSHGVASALATAALTGAFAAATARFAVPTRSTIAARLSSEPTGGAGESQSSAAIALPPQAPVTLDALIVALRASSEGVLRGGQPVAAFLALLDAQAQTIEYTCAGHHGAHLVGPIATIDGSLPVGSGKATRPKATPLGGGTRDPDASMRGATRSVHALPPDTLVVIASSALRGEDDARWEANLRETAPASGRLASVLVDLAVKRGDPSEDLLAVVVRAR